jgi:hypothetical protein
LQNEGEQILEEEPRGRSVAMNDIMRKLGLTSDCSGIPGWQRITVIMIVDGLEAMDKSVLDILAVSDVQDFSLALSHR